MANTKKNYSRWVQTGKGITNVKKAPGLSKAKPKGRKNG